MERAATIQEFICTRIKNPSRITAEVSFSIYLLFSRFVLVVVVVVVVLVVASLFVLLPLFPFPLSRQLLVY